MPPLLENSLLTTSLKCEALLAFFRRSSLYWYTWVALLLLPITTTLFSGFIAADVRQHAFTITLLVYFRAIYLVFLIIYIRALRKYSRETQPAFRANTQNKSPVPRTIWWNISSCSFVFVALVSSLVYFLKEGAGLIALLSVRTTNYFKRKHFLTSTQSLITWRQIHGSRGTYKGS